LTTSMRISAGDDQKSSVPLFFLATRRYGRSDAGEGVGAF